MKSWAGLLNNDLKLTVQLCKAEGCCRSRCRFFTQSLVLRQVAVLEVLIISHDLHQQESIQYVFFFQSTLRLFDQVGAKVEV